MQNEPTPTKDVRGVDNKIDKEEKIEMTQAIVVVSIEEDLSPMQVAKLKVKFCKNKKQIGVENTSIQAPLANQKEIL